MIKKILSFLLSIILLIGITDITSAAGFQFSRNLYPGLRNDPEVVKLQNLLRNLGFFTYPLSTGNYFSITMEAVKKFQTANKIRPASGYFGPLTRGRANRLTNVLQTTFVAPPTNPVPISALPSNNSATSTFRGKIKIDYVSKYENIKPESEYIVIRNNSTTTDAISITGFRLTNLDGEEFIIPRGHNLPGVYATAQNNILLRQYGTVKIISGRQDRQINFRENVCVGYFDQTGNWNDTLTKNCPKPDIRALAPRLPDHCIRVFERTQSCKAVDQSKIQVAECIAFADEHYNYQGCINDNRNKGNFYSNNWFIWMQRPRRFLRDIHDTITLYDSYGKVVDIFTY